MYTGLGYRCKIMLRQLRGLTAGCDVIPGLLLRVIGQRLMVGSKWDFMAQKNRRIYNAKTLDLGQADDVILL